MNWIRIGGVLILLPVLSSPAATLTGATSRPSDSPQAMGFTVEGKITRHSPGKLTISAEENVIFHVRYDEKTEIRRSDGSAGTAKDLRVGTKVKVEGELTETGEVVARKIELEKESASRDRSSDPTSRPAAKPKFIGACPSSPDHSSPSRTRGR